MNTASPWRSRVASASTMVAAGYLLAHLPSLAPSLEDIDSINFGLGLRELSVADHQPHPPGYPVFIALGRVALWVITTVTAALPPAMAEAKALAIWSAIGGAVALIAAARLFRAVDERLDDRASGTSMVWLLAAAPLFWMTGLRPMSDMTGLALALVAQALLVSAPSNSRAFVWGAFVSGVAAGVRVQAACLTLPLFGWALVASRRSGARASWSWLLMRPVAALAVGGLAWLLPLLVASGGVRAYIAALGTQAGEDFSYVDMLWMNPTPRKLAMVLYESFALPWASLPLAAAVAALALVGAVVLLFRGRQALAVVAVAFGPYAVFHLLAQETFHTRYALPLVPPVVWLAAHGIRALAGVYALPATVAAAVASLVVAAPAGLAYGREAHPEFRAIDAMSSAASNGERPVLFQHFSLRRALQAAPPTNVRVVEPRRTFEWLGLVSYWKGGGTAPVWFLADPLRSDPALIDPYARRDVTPFRWAVAERPELGGARPVGTDWYRLSRPGWLAAEGWSLTPETAGLARQTGTSLDRKPIDAFVLRRAEPLRLMVGGRHMFGPVAAAQVTVTIDDSPLAEWTFTPAREGDGFLRFIDLPTGVGPGEGPYARLTIAARPASESAAPVIAIVQFDLQPRDRLMSGFGEGWHEDELDPPTGRRWRWTSERSVLRVEPARDFTLRLRGESPLRYVAAPPRVRITAGGRTVAELSPADDFVWLVPITARDVEEGGGGIAIETDRVYLPGAAEGTSDARHLGLRLFEIEARGGD